MRFNPARHLGVPATASILFVLGGCGPRHEALPAAATGVPIVHLDPSAPGAAPVWRTEVLYTTLSHDSARLDRYLDARLIPDSILIVSRINDLLVFGPDGRLLQLLGRAGDGPGEYKWIYRLGLAADGTLLVGDLGDGRVTRLTPKGGARVTRYLGSLSPSHEVEPLTLLSSGQILATYWQQRPNRDETWGMVGAFRRDSSPLMLFDVDGTRRATLGTWPGLERATVPIGHLAPPFARTALTQARGDFAAISVTDSLDLTLYRDTQAVLHLVGPQPGGTATSEMRTQWEKTLESDFSDAVKAYRDAIRDAPAVPALPALAGLGIGDGGEVWLGLFAAPADTGRRWLVVSPEGKALGEVLLPALPLHTLPGWREVLDVSGDRLALRRETADGEPYVEVRRIFRADGR